eukprot:NODE_47_length_32105_cov_1.240892.p28 type:complete len:106 gc:universal NODE_47_length_32105_cov_1.240892:3660-3343(-)
MKEMSNCMRGNFHCVSININKRFGLELHLEDDKIVADLITPFGIYQSQLEGNKPGNVDSHKHQRELDDITDSVNNSPPPVLSLWRDVDLSMAFEVVELDVVSEDE